MSVSNYLRPDRFDVEPNTSDSQIRWMHWRYTFENFLSEQNDKDLSDSIKLKLLLNHLAPSIYSIIRECPSYKIAIDLLNSTYIKPKNEIYARHMLASRKQKDGESIADFVRVLHQLSHDCNFKCVTAEQHKNYFIRDSFITGIKCQKIRQRLLENMTLSLDDAVNQALTIETADKNSTEYEHSDPQLNATVEGKHSLKIEHSENPVSYSRKRCFFCGSRNLHKRIKCPAFDAVCQLCSKKGHFASVCRSSPSAASTSKNEPLNVIDEVNSFASYSAASPSSLTQSTTSIFINDLRADALIDTGSSMSFINKRVAQDCKLKLKPHKQVINLASLTQTSYVEAICFATITLDKHVYKHQPLLVVNDLCADVIIGHDILKSHKSLELSFGGSRDTLRIMVMEASVPPVSVFTNLSPDIRPIATKSRRHNIVDQTFIREEITKLLKDGVIEPSTSPWRAQVLVTGGDRTHKKRMVVDYSQTINKYTELDAYPLPSIESIISNVAKYNYYSQIDLKSAYHQFPILNSEKKYTAFEACGCLYQFTRIPFGITNGVAAFQRTLEYIIQTEKLNAIYTYLDDVTVCGKTKEDHDRNLQNFMNAVKKYNLTLNEKKCTFGSESINLLGYSICKNIIKPDEDRIRPLLNLPAPLDSSSMKRVLGMFAHYSKWISNFSDKIKPLITSEKFPLDNQAKNCFETLKSDIAKASLFAIDYNETFTVETDASDYAIAATLSQNRRPVAFFSRTLSGPERRHSSIEKEAAAIIEALRKWRHYLIGRHFNLITDQKSVSFMFNHQHTSKIKNEKIERWRLELSCYKYDIIYRPGKYNTVPDALSRVCAHIVSNNLYNLHTALCHPGITRMFHWVRSKNLPYSLEDIKTMNSSCRVCAEVKPRFFMKEGHLIKAVAPFERLNIDFKGPLPTNTQNKYILTVIDEYSRFPFAYPCKDTSAETTIKALKDIFFTFGFPQFIHSDRGAAFMSKELLTFLNSLGVATSRTTPYNPQGNGQVERLNGTLWRTIQLALKCKKLDISNWEIVLPGALHSIRSLLCTSTNVTPHDRLFNYPRRTPCGESLPSWLMNPGPVLMKKTVRASKYDPLVEEVELLQGNPNYSYIRHKDGRESSISNRHLAPLPNADVVQDLENEVNVSDENNDTDERSNDPDEESNEPRRSGRIKCIPKYLKDYELEK